MMEQDWLDCADPCAMLLGPIRDAGPRKLRLFACACCRRVWHLLGDPSRRAVEAAEAFADGEVSADVLIATGREAWEAVGAAGQGTDRDVAWAAWELTGEATAEMAMEMAELPLRGVFGEDAESESNAQAALLRCVFNPFRPFAVTPAILCYNDAAVVRLATVIYEERDPTSGLLDNAKLAILADALEEAGVDDGAALEHLRGEPHCRGCHVLDAVLGRG